MRDNLALDLQIGLKNSQVNGEQLLTCQVSGIHANFRLSHEETPRMGPQPAVGPTLWGHRDLREQTVNMEREQTKMGSIQTP